VVLVVRSTVGRNLDGSAAQYKQQVKSLLYGQEINPETYAICKADMILKGEGENADNIVGGAEWSTLAHDAFPAQIIRLHAGESAVRQKLEKRPSTPWEANDGMRDPRFKVMHRGEELSLVTRSSDGQNALSRQYGLQDEPDVGAWAAALPKSTMARRSLRAMPVKARATFDVGLSKTTGLRRL
jgi:hypothetical protein